MPHPQQQRILDALWPNTQPRWSKVCAVLDGARDERIFSAVERCGLEKCCLYAGELPWVLQRAAPYLIVLDREDRFTRYLIDEGWGDSWGIYLRTEASMLELRRHLRRILRVKTESGKTLIFRWYDPRVIRPYLPSCNAGELRTVFGPIDRFSVEGDSPSTLIEYFFNGQALNQMALDLNVQRP